MKYFKCKQSHLQKIMNFLTLKYIPQVQAKCICSVLITIDDNGKDGRFIVEISIQACLT